LDAALPNIPKGLSFTAVVAIPIPAARGSALLSSEDAAPEGALS